MTTKEKRKGTIVLCGDAKVGKSNLRTMYFDGLFSSEYEPTIGVDIGIKNLPAFYNNVDLKVYLWDIAGIERFRPMSTSYYRDIHGVILVFDVTNRDSFDNLITTWMKEVDENATDVIRIVIGNKVDCDESERQVSKEEAEEFASSRGLKYFETSAKSNVNVSESIEYLGREILMKILKAEGHVTKPKPTGWSSWFKGKLGIQDTTTASATVADPAPATGGSSNSDISTTDTVKTPSDGRLVQTAAELQALVTKFSDTLGAMSSEYENMQALRQQLESTSLSAAGQAAAQAELRNIEAKYKSSPEDQTEREYIAANPALTVHYERMQKVLNEAFLVAAALSGGMIAVEKTSASGVFGAVIKLSQGIPIVPGVLSFVAVGVDAVLQVRQEGRFSFLAALNPTSNPADAGRWSERVARHITVTTETVIVSIHEKEKQSELTTITRFLTVLEKHARSLDKGLAEGLFATDSAVELLTMKHAKIALDHILAGMLDGKDDPEAVVSLVETVAGCELKRLVAVAAGANYAPVRGPVPVCANVSSHASSSSRQALPPPPTQQHAGSSVIGGKEGDSQGSTVSGNATNTTADADGDGDGDDSLRSWLKKALGKLATTHLESCVSAFEASGIETHTELMHLSASDLTHAELQTMGVKVIGVRNKILIQFEQDKFAATVVSSPSPPSVPVTKQPSAISRTEFQLFVAAHEETIARQKEENQAQAAEISAQRAELERQRLERHSPVPVGSPVSSRSPEDVASATLVETLVNKLGTLEAKVAKIRNAPGSNSGAGGGQMLASAEDEETESGYTVKESVEQLKRELLSLQQHVHGSHENTLGELLAEVQRMQFK